MGHSQLTLRPIEFYFIFFTFSMTLNDLQIVSRARYYSTLNFSETVQDKDIVEMKY